MMRLFGNSQGAHAGEEMLSAYLDDQVTAAERTRVEAHLQGCASCRGELQSLRQMVLLLQALPRVPVPRAFTLSEAQAGIRRPEARPWWSGAWVRGLGAVTAVALVALVAMTLLRPPAWAPGATVARVSPTEVVAQSQAVAQPEVATQPPAVPQPEIAVQSEAAVEESVQAPAAEARSAAPAEAPIAAPAADLAASPTEALTMAAPVAAKQAGAQPQAEVVTLEADEAPTAETAQEVEALAAAAPEGLTSGHQMDGQPGAALGMGGGFGIGGGGGVAAAAFAAAPAAALTPSAAPALAPIASVLPKQAGVAYADWQSLSVLDAASNGRELARAEGTYAPLISDARTWVAYRAQAQGGAEIGLVSWDGATRTRLLSERDLAAEPFEAGYNARSIQTMRWIPGQAKLAVVTAAFPAQADLSPVQELWHLAAPTGARERILQMGQMGRVFYAPDGQRLAVLEYGTVDAPKGSLTLYSANGGQAQAALSFPAAPGIPAFPTQLQWLPDGSGLLLALPEAPVSADVAPGMITLVRVSAAGEAEQLGRIEAQETFWSPDGSRLAYIRPASAAAGGQELVLAGTDGADPQVVSALQNGQFLGWSPDGRQFLYTDDYEVYAGGPGRKPEHLGNTVSLYDPRWAAPGQIVSLLDQGTGWMLVWRNLDTGESASLASLPKEISWDFVSP